MTHVTRVRRLLVQPDWDCGKFAIAHAIRGSSKALAPLWIAKAIWWHSAPSLNRILRASLDSEVMPGQATSCCEGAVGLDIKRERGRQRYSG
jgi:hypothetical protein